MIRRLSRLIGNRNDIEYHITVNAKSKLLRLNNSKVILVGTSPIRSEIYQGINTIYGDRLIISHGYDGHVLMDKYGDKYNLKPSDPCVLLSYVYRFHTSRTSWLHYEMDSHWFEELRNKSNPVIYIFSVLDKDMYEIENKSLPESIKNRDNSNIKMVRWYPKSKKAYAEDMITAFDSIRSLTDDI
jgi:hypothetical protein